MLAEARVQDSSRPLRVCLLTGGGDAPGLNAAIRAFMHAAERRNVLVCTSHFGFEGLLGGEELSPLRIRDVRGILPRGGSTLGCSTRSNPFAGISGTAFVEAIEKLKARLREFAIDALVLAGGDGTMAIAKGLGESGARRHSDGLRSASRRALRCARSRALQRPPLWPNGLSLVRAR